MASPADSPDAVTPIDKMPVRRQVQPELLHFHLGCSAEDIAAFQPERCLSRNRHRVAAKLVFLVVGMTAYIGVEEHVAHNGVEAKQI